LRDVGTLFESLDDRVMAGFGGVAEYGNHGALGQEFPEAGAPCSSSGAPSSRCSAAYASGVPSSSRTRWSSVSTNVALAMGAGKPTVLEHPQRPSRAACAPPPTFLMALQLTGAAKLDSIAKHAAAPAGRRGRGGLTAIDTATESLAYYLVQIEKFLTRFEALAAESGEDAVRASGTTRSARSPRNSSRTARRGAKRSGRPPSAGPRGARGRAAAALGRRDHRVIAGG